MKDLKDIHFKQYQILLEFQEYEITHFKNAIFQKLINHSKT